MQELNVGAGRTDEEYKAAEEQKRADLRADSLNDANYFFWAAGLAALGTGVFPLKLNIVVTVGFVDLLALYGRTLGPFHAVAVFGISWLWVVALISLGLVARSGCRWAFLAGMALYAADMIPLIVLFSLWSFGVHAFFLFKWFQGQQALKDLREAPISVATAAG